MKTSYTFMLDGVRFPMAIQKIKRKNKSGNKTIRTMKGPLNRLGGPTLADIQVKGLLCWNWPPEKGETEKEQEETPDYYIELLWHWKRSKLPVTLDAYDQNGESSAVLTGIRYVTIEDFTYVESAENGGDFDLELSLKEYARMPEYKLEKRDGKEYVVEVRPDYVTEGERLLFEKRMKALEERLEGGVVPRGGVVVVAGRKAYYFAMEEYNKWESLIQKEANLLLYGGEKE